MRLLKQSWSFEEPVDGLDILRKIERAGRTCYKSEDKITDDSAAEFCRRMLNSGHHSVLEHHNITVRFITNRGVTHELVRHRLAAYSQESTRYCDYGGDHVVFIWPVWCNDFLSNLVDAPTGLARSILDGIHVEKYPLLYTFLDSLRVAEDSYQFLLEYGWKPQQAREVLPNALKTEIVVTANIREWRHIFNLRCSAAAHPQIRALMLGTLQGFMEAVPVLFDDLAGKYLEDLDKKYESKNLD